MHIEQSYFGNPSYPKPNTFRIQPWCLNLYNFWSSLVLDSWIDYGCSTDPNLPCPHSWPPITKSQVLLASGVYNQGNQSVQDIVCLFLNLQAIFQLMFLPQSHCCGPWHVLAGPSPLPVCSYHSGYCSTAPTCVDFPTSLLLLRLLVPWNQRPYFDHSSFSWQVCLAQKPCSAY